MGTEGSDSTTYLGQPTDVYIDPETDEAFIADGYTNRRVIVVDANTGEYKRHWGAYGNQPDDTRTQTMASSRDFHFARRIRAFITPTRLSARQISSSHVASLPVEAALDVEPTRAPAFRASLRHRSTPMLFLRQADFVALRPGVSRPAPVAPRSSAACRRTAAGSDALLPAGASSTAHASPGGLRFSPAAAEDS